MPASIRFRWDPQAVDCLLQLEDEGRADGARRIVQEIRDRLGKQPGIYRFVRITGLKGPRSRRLTAVQRVYLGDSCHTWCTTAIRGQRPWFMCCASDTPAKDR